MIRAVQTLAAATGREPLARFHLRKQIPLAAGLAGGSADAAATLVACDALWGTGFGREELAGVAAELGSDVPFLVLGGTALGTGRGDEVSPVLAPGHAWHWVVAVRRRWPVDAGCLPGAGPAARGRAGPTVGRLDRRDPCRAAAAGRRRARRSRWSTTSRRLRSRCGRRSGRRSTPACRRRLAAMVSGSGPTCVFLCRDSASAEVAAALDDSGTCRAARTATGPVPGARLI